MTAVPVRRRRRIRWLIGVLLVAALVVAAVLAVVGSANRRQADDPRSPIATGAGALGQLLSDQGVQITTTSRVEDAAAAVDPTTTLVVANADQLDEVAAGRLLGAGAARAILLRPNTPALVTFDVRATARTPEEGSFAPECAAEVAQLAGPITVEDLRASYQATGPADFACYPAGAGHAYLRASTGDGVPVDLVGGGISNAALGTEGNAAFAMNVFGGQPRIVWLMAQRVDAPDATGRPPTLLPPWWPIAMLQFAVAFLITAIWRGRRLGPILSEPLPVTVRAAETVEGHGRLYYRLSARDRAAEALRVGSRQRLSRAFGHADDPLALSAAVAARTGLDPGRVRWLLFDAAPGTDDDLVDLARDLDRLEQEARQL
jgi:hypothetical protein